MLTKYGFNFVTESDWVLDLNPILLTQIFFKFVMEHYVTKWGLIL